MELAENGAERLSSYACQAKAAWGGTEAYKEYERRSAGRPKEKEQQLGSELMSIFAGFGRAKAEGNAPDSPEVLGLVKELQAFITGHYYSCTDEILLALGSMYRAGGAFTENIDRAGGAGTAAFADKAIEAMLKAKRG